MRAGLPRVKQTELSRTCKDDKGWLYTKLRWPLLGASFCGSACTVYACVPPMPLHRACSSEIISGQWFKLKERKEGKQAGLGLVNIILNRKLVLKNLAVLKSLNPGLKLCFPNSFQ